MDNIKSSQTSEQNELTSKYLPFLIEIRKRILLTLFVFSIATVIGFIFNERIIKLLINILALQGVNVVFTSPFQFINLAISCGMATGLVIVFPFILYQILSFLRPALREQEYKMIVRFLPFTIALFLIGFSFGVFIMRWQIQLFLTKSVELGIGNVLDISRLLSTVLLISSIMGIAFQFPIVILLLTRIGIIKASNLSKQRLWFYLGSFIFVALLPADSILADILLAVPLVLLFELTLLLNRIFERRKVAYA